MAETPSPPPPSPYAPGIISEERTPPRPAGRAVVFLAAIFVMTLVTTPAFWWNFARRSLEVSGLARPTLELFVRVSTVSSLLTLLWAYLSDRVAVWGTRREGYLLLCGLTMAVIWLVLTVLGTHDIAWVIAAVEFGLAPSVARAVVSGGLAEIGQRRAATGRVAAVYMVATRVALVAAAPLAAAFAFAPLPVTAGIAAGLSVALVVLIITLSDDGTRPPDGPALPTVTIWQFLRSRTFWSLALFLTIASLVTVPRELIVSHLWANHSGTMMGVSLRLKWIESAAEVAAALGYLFLCRRLPLRNVLRVALLATALLLIAFSRTLQSGTGGELDGAVGALAASNGLVIVAAFDLVLRAAPRGREASGAILLSAFSAFTTGILNSSADRLQASASHMAWFAAAAAIAGGLAVSLLPRVLVARRDGEHAAAQ